MPSGCICLSIISCPTNFPYGIQVSVRNIIPKVSGLIEVIVGQMLTGVPRTVGWLCHIKHNSKKESIRYSSLRIFTIIPFRGFTVPYLLTIMGHSC